MVLSAIALAGCSGSGLKETLNMKNCKYTYGSISDLSVGGIKPADGLTVYNTAVLVTILSGSRSSVPVSFVLTIDVKNTNSSTASFSGMKYKVNIDGLDFTEGAIEEPFSVAAGETKPLKIGIKTDIAHMLKGENRETSANIMKNFIGIGDEESTVKVYLWPIFTVAGQSVQSPVAFPVEFKFGGKQQQ